MLGLSGGTMAAAGMAQDMLRAAGRGGEASAARLDPQLVFARVHDHLWVPTCLR